MYLPQLNVYFKSSLGNDEFLHVVGMLRGLLNSFGGYKALSGLSNRKFINALRTKQKVPFKFSNYEKANEFKKIVTQYFADVITARRVRHVTSPAWVK